MSSFPPQSDSPPQYLHKQLSGTSVALICVFFLCFIGIVYLSAKAPRATTRVLAASSAARRWTARGRRPRLLEIWLDRHLGGTVHNWRPLAAWHSDGSRREMTANHRTALVQAWVGRASAFFPERRGAIQFAATPPPAAQPLVSDPPALNVAVLVVMPRREGKEQVPGSTLGSGFLYNEGQLELGVTSLLCEQAVPTASSEEHYQWTT